MTLKRTEKKFGKNVINNNIYRAVNFQDFGHIHLLDKEQEIKARRKLSAIFMTRQFVR
jgi:hypothetical protein